MVINKQINEFKEMLYGYSTDKFLLIENHLYLNIFLYDKDFGVRGRVAREGYGDKILQYDEYVYVRWYVVQHTNNKTILEYLSNDENNNIRDLAIIRLNELYNE